MVIDEKVKSDWGCQRQVESIEGEGCTIVKATKEGVCEVRDEGTLSSFLATDNHHVTVPVYLITGRGRICACGGNAGWHIYTSRSQVSANGWSEWMHTS